MKVVVGCGDSFVFGTELRDQTYGTPSKNTFPALLAQDAGLPYACTAKAGASNSTIARHTLNYCETHKDIEKYLIVSWTFANRFEFKFEESNWSNDGGWESINVWNLQEAEEIRNQFKNFDEKTLQDQLRTNARFKRTGLYEFSKSFFKHVASYEYWETYNSLRDIVLLQNYLDLNKISYIFTFADNSLIDNYTTNNPDTSISSLLNQIKLPDWFSFSGDPNMDGKHRKGFYQWALENKYKIGATHPLEGAHADAAQLMKEKFYDMVKKSN